MNLADLSIRRSVFAWMIMAGLIVFGAIGFGRLGVSLMPDVDFPILEIRTTWEGAAPEIMEAELVDPIEQKVIAVEGIKEVRSTIQRGQATISIEFQLSRDIDAAVQEVQAAISQVKLPLGVDQPVIRKSSSDSDPIMFIGLTGKQSLRELITFVDTFLIDEFQVIPGVGEVSLNGYSDRNLRLWVDGEKLKRYQLTVLDLQQALARQHVEVAAGYMENDQRELNVRAMGEGMTPEEVGDLVIAQRGGQPIYDATIRVRDVARVEDGLSDIRRLARMDGEPGLNFGIRKQRGANEVMVGHAVQAKVDELNTRLPEGMRLKVVVNITRFVEDAVRETNRELIISAILTALICYLFLGNWSSAFNIILSIPTSIVGTFTILFFMGFTLNTFTLLGLALAIGIVVDDAIMMLENIVRHFHMGKNRVQAARDGAREITFAAVAATLAVIAIFLPVAFMSGIIGRFFFQFGVTITAAVALSLLEAITLTPMRCSQFLHMSDKPGLAQRGMDGLFRLLSGAYRRSLALALRARFLVVLAALVVFAVSLREGKHLRREFVPPQDQNFMRISLQTPVGSSLAFTDQKVREVERYLKGRPEVDKFFVAVGSQNGVPSQAFAAVALVEKEKRPLSQGELTKLFRNDFGAIKGLRATFQDLSTRGLAPRSSKPVEFNLRGPDYKVLNEKSQEIMKRLEATGLMVDLDNNYRAGMPELRIWPDRAAAALRGVSMETIADTISVAIGGAREGKFTHDGRRYDVRIRLNPEERMTEEDVRRLEVRTQYGELVPLSDVVRTEIVPTVQTISRVNRQRSVSVTAGLAPEASQTDALAAAERISKEALPPGYTFNLEGGAQTFNESFSSLWFTFVLGIVVAYMVLASQFNSFLHPLTVLLALPFSISGALWALRLGDQSINLYSAIGLILLMGIAKKNSILLVEFTNKLRFEEHLEVKEALLRAGPIRLRPILMTSLATVAAAIPLALGWGPGAESRMPMSMAIIGGVIVSTLFTLFVVPCAYSLMSRFERRPPVDHLEFDEIAELRSTSLRPESQS